MNTMLFATLCGQELYNQCHHQALWFRTCEKPDKLAYIRHHGTNIAFDHISIDHIAIDHIAVNAGCVSLRGGEE